MGILRTSVFALNDAFGLAVGLAGVVLVSHLHEGNLTHGPMPEGQKADVVMVFTGESNRIAHGYNIIEAGIGDRLMISGKDYPENSLEEDIRTVASKVGTDRVKIDPLATSTIQNATNSAAWARDNDIKSIVLITSTAHMMRAHFELRRLLPYNVKIYTDTVKGMNLDNGLDSEFTRTACRLFETKLQEEYPWAEFCYQTRTVARHWGVFAMN